MAEPRYGNTDMAVDEVALRTKIIVLMPILFYRPLLPRLKIDDLPFEDSD